MTSSRTMGRVGDVVNRYPVVVVTTILIVTLLFIFPMMNIEADPSTSAFAPDHEVPRAEDTIRRDFSDPVHKVYTVVEARGDNVLSRECLIEISRIEDSIRSDVNVRRFLIGDPSNVTSIADAVGQTLELMFGTDLEGASGSQLDQVINISLQVPELKALMSKDLTYESGGYRAKAAMIVVQLNNTLISSLGPENEEGQLAVKYAVLGNDLTETRVGVLAGFETEMGEGMKDGLTLLPISLALIVTVLFFSLRRRVVDVLISVIGIPMVFLWMFGITGLIGLKMTMLSFFAPILILALGIDYAIHSLHRYREEREKGVEPGEAAETSITQIGAAILLATVTTAAAFFSNILSGLPAVRDFGLVIGIGIISAFVIMGIFVPALRSLVDRKIPVKGKKGREPGKENPRIQRITAIPSRGILRIAKMPFLVIPVVLVLTGGSVLGALQVGTEFSLGDVLQEDSQVWRAMDMMEEHFVRGNTEKVMILVEGEVADPEVLLALEETVGNMEGDEHLVAVEGELPVTYICQYVFEIMENFTLRDDLAVMDVNGDLVPDSTTGVVRVFDHLYEMGIGNVSSVDIQHLLHKSKDGDYDRTVIWLEASGSGGNEKEVKKELEEDSLPLERLEDEGKINCVVTGEPIVIYTVLAAITGTMISSILICLSVCFVILMFAFRSVKFGIVTMIPVCLVTTWILGSMYLLGYDFNVVTILIGAISIGVGVDYSIHITHRYREERENGKGPEDAMADTIYSTGTALLGAAATTALGFSVLMFASFGAFVAFGILTAIMIIYSYIGAIFVLPMLLLLVDRT
ncbi:MAG: RND family transporter [Thermoplasmata archaeon]|nr:RND family transporter [Thermoplasmata archaeon]